MVWRSPIKNGYVSSKGLKLYYKIEGEGQPLFLLNGCPGFSHEYLEPLRVLASDFQVVFFDQRGTGKSDKANPRDYTVKANVEDVEQLRRGLELGPCVVFGHSWGGMLAQAYALEYPSHLTKLILADTFCSIADCNAALSRMRNNVPDATRAIYERYEREGLYKNRDRYADEYQAALDVAYEPVFISVPPPEYLVGMFNKVAYDIYRVMWGEETEFRVTGTLAEFDVMNRLPEIKAPTLVMVGASDMPTIAMAEKMAHLIPKARLEIFQHSRHFPFIEEPDKFLSVMREFLNATE